ncbi:MAG: PadR family transcriptional regulator [Candidatus Hodarchaeota archaeon]
MSKKHKIKVQSITRFYILLLLKSKNSITGYQIIKLLEKDLGTTASPTGIYDFLNDLKSEGYIEDVLSPNSKRSKGFQLTTSGSEFIDRIFSRFDNLIEVAVQSKLKACASCGVNLYNNFYIETIHGKELNFCCKHCAKAYKNLLHKNQY